MKMGWSKPDCKWVKKDIQCEMEEIWECLNNKKILKLIASEVQIIKDRK